MLNIVSCDLRFLCKMNILCVGIRLIVDSENTKYQMLNGVVGVVN